MSEEEIVNDSNTLKDTSERLERVCGERLGEIAALRRRLEQAEERLRREIAWNDEAVRNCAKRGCAMLPRKLQDAYDRAEAAEEKVRRLEAWQDDAMQLLDEASSGSVDPETWIQDHSSLMTHGETKVWRGRVRQQAAEIADLRARLRRELEPATRARELYDNWERAHLNNLDVWRRFDCLALQVAQIRKRSPYAASTILSVVQFERDIMARDGEGGEIELAGWPFYARLWMAVHPEHSGFFLVGPGSPWLEQQIEQLARGTMRG